VLLKRKRQFLQGPRAPSIRQHTSVYVSIRQHMPASVSIRQHSSAYVYLQGPLAPRGRRPLRQHTPAYVSIRQLTKAYVSIRQHTPAYVSIRQHSSVYVDLQDRRAPRGRRAVLDVSIRQHPPAYVSIRLPARSARLEADARSSTWLFIDSAIAFLISSSSS
jgi:hypothetical protein